MLSFSGNRVFIEGPDVIISLTDLDPSDETVEVIASQFFSRKVSLHSIKVGPCPRIVFNRVIDDQCGAAFSSVLADLDGLASMQTSVRQAVVIDSGSTVDSLNKGDAFSHLLVTSHEGSQYGCTINPNGQSEIDGGSLFAYRVPTGKNAWKTRPWLRSTVASGFKVEHGVKNMINPGAPGFCYTFFPTKEGPMNDKMKWRRPLIGLSGDCSESAYILQPTEGTSSLRGMIEGAIDRSTRYALMSEIKCGSTVGSLAIGYARFGSNDTSGCARIYVPCYEEDKVLVFGMTRNNGQE